MENFKISANLLQAIMNYLATKPFNEVSQIINAVQKEVADQQSLQEKKSIVT